MRSCLPRSPASAVLASLLLLGCGSSPPADAVDAGIQLDADVDPADPDPIFAIPVASILVAETAYPGGSSVGEVLVGIYDTEPEFHTETSRDGQCRVLRYDAAFCDPGCNFDQLCRQNVCTRYPRIISAGTLQISGLAVNVSMIPRMGYYETSPQQLPADLFDGGATIEVTAPGADFNPFTLSASGAPTVQLDLDGDANDELRLTDGADFTMQWTGADAGSRVRMQLASPTQAHGLPSTVLIECDAPDTGSLTIPRDMVEAFPAQTRNEICAGHDCPLSTFMRYRRAAGPTVDGDVELLVASRQQFFLTH